MNPFVLQKPSSTEYHSYYENYIAAASEQDIWELLQHQTSWLKKMFVDVPEEETTIFHLQYTWTLRQVIGHLIDVERTFSFRLMHVAVGWKEDDGPVGDAQPLVGMDQDQYVNQFDYDPIPIQKLLDELHLTRQSNLMLIHRLRPEMLDRKCVVSDCEVTVRALIFKLAGHIRYHRKIVAKRLQQEFLSI